MAGTAGQTPRVDAGAALAFAEAYKPASTYDTIWVRSANAGAGASGTFILNSTNFVQLNTAGSALGAFRLDPANMPTIPGLAKKLRLDATVVPGAVAPGVDFAVHLYPVATWGGASGAQPLVATVGASLGSTSFPAPSGAPISQVTADLAYPAAGLYVVALVTSGVIAVNSNSSCIVALQRRWA
jgi:hypothetical protein